MVDYIVPTSGRVEMVNLENATRGVVEVLLPLTGRRQDIRGSKEDGQKKGLGQGRRQRETRTKHRHQYPGLRLGGDPRRNEKRWRRGTERARKE